MKCIHCGKEIDSAYAVNEDDEPICYDCYCENYEPCEKCGRAVPHGEHMCHGCSDEVFRKQLNSYGTKLTNRFGNKGNSIKCLNDRYYGLELEYNYFSPATARALFKEQYNNHLIYNKSDSSISNGVEIVTIPLVKSKMIKLIDDMDVSRIKPSIRGESVLRNAGLHIHVSRNTISPIAIHRLSLLFNSNWAYYYKKFIYYLVGRANDLNHTTNDSYFALATTGMIDSHRNVAGHCVAINLGNANTVEFRLFKATTNPVQLKSYIEFTELAIKFAETQPIKRMTIPNFIVYLSLNVTNEWLRTRLEKIKKDNPECFEAKDKQFTLDYYLSKFNCDIEKTYELLDTIREKVASRYLNWDVKEINDDVVYRWASNSCGSDKNCRGVIDKIQDKIKSDLVEKILAK